MLNLQQFQTVRYNIHVKKSAKFFLRYKTYRTALISVYLSLHQTPVYTARLWRWA